jgi:cytoskeleton protein RodZ
MASVGEKLKRARIALRLDLGSVAAVTRVNLKYLQAIEADDPASLPSAFFYKSFVHQYASAVSLDPSELDADVDVVVKAEPPLPLPGQVLRESEQRGSWFSNKSQVASYGALLLVLLGCSGIYSWWRKTPDTPPDKARTVASTKPAAKTIPAASATTAVPVSNPIPSYKVLLQLLARETTWLSVSSDGRRVFSGILAANESKSIEGKEYAQLKVGNAAGLEVRLNGKLISPLGGRGQVLMVVFHPDNFVIIPPAPREGD